MKLDITIEGNDGLLYTIKGVEFHQNSKDVVDALKRAEVVRIECDRQRIVEKQTLWVSTP